MNFKGMVTNKPEIVEVETKSGNKMKKATVVCEDAQSGMSFAGTAWGERAEKLCAAVAAEQKKVIPGNMWDFKIVLLARSWTTQDGDRRYSTEVTIDDFKNIANL